MGTVLNTFSFSHVYFTSFRYLAVAFSSLFQALQPGAARAPLAALSDA